MGDLDIPVLVIQGSNDPVVDPQSAQEILEKLETKDREFCGIDAERHGIIRGEGSEKIFEKVELFLNRNFKKPRKFDYPLRPHN